MKYSQQQKEEDTKKQSERIKEAEETGSYKSINEHLLKKRKSWLEKNKHLQYEVEGSDLRKAYEIVLIRYIGIDPKEIPIVHEDEKKIVWRSFNWCPVLDACKKLDLDTKKVCKKGWEESVDAMVKMINPKMKFSRNYEKIRPHTDYCEEMFEIVE